MKPTVFIGSSTEGLGVAYVIQDALQHTTEPTVWTQGIFDLSKSTLSSLLEALNKYDFAILVLTPDDVTKLRNKEVQTPRDNVIFELGLFMGALGQDRTYFVVPQDSADLHLPSDLLGIKPATYNAARRDGNLNAATGPACHKISQSIMEQCKQYRLKYGEDIINIFRDFEKRIKQILIKLISDAEIPEDFPLPQSLKDESVSGLSSVCDVLNISSDNLIMINYYTLAPKIIEKGNLATPIEILEIRQHLGKLEDMISSWEATVL
jgi:hypothetical protein